MGVKVYWLIVVMIIALGMVLPQRGPKKKTYIILMASIHTFVCGFRYMHLVGDLMKYHYEFNTMMGVGYFERLTTRAQNVLFYWLMKTVAEVTDGNFQIFLMLLAIITQGIIALLIFKYSPQPWLSYLVWNCMAFLSHMILRPLSRGWQWQSLCARLCAFWRRMEKDFCFFTILAGMIHMPALCFLPAFWLSKLKINQQSMFAYAMATVVFFLFRRQIITIALAAYYEDESIELNSAALGGRFLIIAFLLLCGLLVKGFEEKNFECLFNLIVVGAFLQMLSGFNNIFTRLADYYLQLLVLYIPMLFYRADSNAEQNSVYLKPALFFDRASTSMLIALASMILVLYYWRTCLGVTISYSVDDYTNFRFMWDVATDFLW